jgi:hypothetical protein
MSQPFRFDRNRTGSALVIFFPPEVKGVFNSAIHGLVREVQEQLDGVFVTYALSSSGSPDLRDALAAARFAGCESAVVVPASGIESTQLDDFGSTGDWMLASAPHFSELDAPVVVDAFRAALAEAEKAA